eukprot:354745-Chlamydomonas_euryale.AAC.5
MGTERGDGVLGAVCDLVVAELLVDALGGGEEPREVRATRTAATAGWGSVRGGGDRGKGGAAGGATGMFCEGRRAGWVVDAWWCWSSEAQQGTLCWGTVAAGRREVHALAGSTMAARAGDAVRRRREPEDAAAETASCAERQKGQGRGSGRGRGGLRRAEQRGSMAWQGSHRAGEPLPGGGADGDGLLANPEEGGVATAPTQTKTVVVAATACTPRAWCQRRRHARLPSVPPPHTHMQPTPPTPPCGHGHGTHRSAMYHADLPGACHAAPRPPPPLWECPMGAES